MLTKLAIVGAASALLHAAIHFALGSAANEMAILGVADAFFSDLETGRLEQAQDHLSASFRGAGDMPAYRTRRFGPVSTGRTSHRHIGVLRVDLRCHDGDRALVVTLVHENSAWKIDGWHVDR